MDGYPTVDADKATRERSERMQGQLNGDRLRLLIVEDEGSVA